MNAARYSWILAVVGGIGITAFGSLWFVFGEVGAVAQVSGVLGAISLVAYAFIDRDRLQEGASGREAMASAGTALAVLLGVCLAGLLVALTNQFDQTADLTRSGRYTLSSRTRNVLDGLDQDVTIYGIFQLGMPERERFERMSDLYGRQSARVTVEVVDPLMQPTRVGALIQSTGNADMDRLASTGTILLVSGNKRRRLESRFDEEAITNGLVKLTSGADKRVCWSVGHGERNPDDDESSDGWGGTVLRLEDRNVVITTERFLTSGVDRACDAVMIVGPTRDFQPIELEALAAYIAEKGQVFLSVDAPPEGTDLPNLRAELERYGIAMGEDVIVENNPSNVAQGPEGEPLYAYDGLQFKQHPIVQLDTIITPRWPRSVQATDKPVGIQVAELVASTQQAWAETGLDFDASELPQPDPDEQVGPVPFVVLAEILDAEVLEVDLQAGADADAPTPDSDDTDASSAPPTPLALQSGRSILPSTLSPEPGGRLFVMGDADIGGNALTTYYGNGDLVLNAVSFLLDETDQLGEGPTTNEKMLLSDVARALLYLLGIVLVPGFALVTGLALLIRRRFL